MFDFVCDLEFVWFVVFVYEFGIVNCVIFVGWCDCDVLYLYYSVVDVFVMMLWYELFGIMLVEVMVCVMVVIGSDVGGICMMVDDGMIGYFVLLCDLVVLVVCFV